MNKELTYEKCIRKANQHWEMAGLARQDGDTKDAERHTKLAREWDEKARSL
jgi:hypothetical protein